jgi:hypothetical protein
MLKQLQKYDIRGKLIESITEPGELVIDDGTWLYKRYVEFKDLRFIEPNILYDTIINDSRSTLPIDLQVKERVSQYYEGRFLQNLQNVYTHSPAFFDDNFQNNKLLSNDTAFEQYQLYIYLLCHIVFVIDNRDDIFVNQINKFNEILLWCVTRRDTSFEYIIQGPQSNTIPNSKYREHYEIIISPSNDPSTTIQRQQIARSILISDDLYKILEFMRNYQNTYFKNPDNARVYNVNLSTINNTSWTSYVDNQFNLVFNFNNISIKSEDKDNTSLTKYFELESKITNNVSYPLSSIKKLELIFKQYSRIRIYKLEVGDDLYSSNLSAFDHLFISFPKIFCSTRITYSDDSDNILKFSGKFTDNEGYFSFNQSSDYISYDSKSSKVESIEFTITPDIKYNYLNRINTHLSFITNDVFQLGIMENNKGDYDSFDFCDSDNIGIILNKYIYKLNYNLLSLDSKDHSFNKIYNYPYFEYYSVNNQYDSLYYNITTDNIYIDYSNYNIITDASPTSAPTILLPNSNIHLSNMPRLHYDYFDIIQPDGEIYYYTKFETVIFDGINPNSFQMNRIEIDRINNIAKFDISLSFANTSDIVIRGGLNTLTGVTLSYISAIPEFSIQSITDAANKDYHELFQVGGNNVEFIFNSTSHDETINDYVCTVFLDIEFRVNMDNYIQLLFISNYDGSIYSGTDITILIAVANVGLPLKTYQITFRQGMEDPFVLLNILCSNNSDVVINYNDNLSLRSKTFIHVDDLFVKYWNSDIIALTLATLPLFNVSGYQIKELEETLELKYDEYIILNNNEIIHENILITPDSLGNYSELIAGYIKPIIIQQTISSSTATFTYSYIEIDGTTKTMTYNVDFSDTATSTIKFTFNTTAQITVTRGLQNVTNVYFDKFLITIDIPNNIVSLMFIDQRFARYRIINGVVSYQRIITPLISNIVNSALINRIYSLNNVMKLKFCDDVNSNIRGITIYRTFKTFQDIYIVDFAGNFLPAVINSSLTKNGNGRIMHNNRNVLLYNISDKYITTIKGLTYELLDTHTTNIMLTDINVNMTLEFS